MKNNKGFGTKEAAVLILALLFIFAGLFMSVMKGASKQKVITFSENALTFQKTAVGNQSSFINPEIVYLQEVIEEQFMKDIKNALGSGNCSREESKVVTDDGHVYTTLKCGHYLIDNVEIKDVKDVKIYVVSDWTEKKLTGKNVEKKVLYNIEDSGKVVFDKYYEDTYLPYKVSKEYGDYIVLFDEIEKKTALKVLSKTFYRTKDKLEVRE